MDVLWERCTLVHVQVCVALMKVCAKKLKQLDVYKEGKSR